MGNSTSCDDGDINGGEGHKAISGNCMDGWKWRVKLFHDLDRRRI
jgi:hypothetical protein